MCPADANTRFHESHWAAIVLVVLSGLTFFCLSMALQVLAWELRPLLDARFGWDERNLPMWTAAFVDLFGYRPDAYLTYVVWWFWWPMVGSLGYCHVRYQKPRDFAAAFMFAFVVCWLVFVLFLSVVLMICSMPFVILLAEFHEPPAVASVIMPLSWVIPTVTAIFVAIAWWRGRK